MIRWLLRRLVSAVAILAAVVTLVFFAIHLAPGTPFLPASDRPLNPAVEARLRARFGLDQPLPVQYARYLSALAHGDLGESFRQQRPVSRALADTMPNTLLLALAALLVDFGLGITAGAWQAARAGRFADRALTAGSLLLWSLPTFWLGLLLLLVLGQWLHWFPVGGISDPVLGGSLLDRLHHLALPALTLGIVGAAGTARFQRSAMREVLARDFIRTARATGAADGRVLRHHVLRNALLPAITLFGLALPFLLTGSVVVETVFAWPGMGKLAADAINARDYPVIMATTLVATLLVVAGSLAADLLYAAADPRIGGA
jgi:peptide/nickel transport system permease protein